jgi:hypothetical protein
MIQNTIAEAEGRVGVDQVTGVADEDEDEDGEGDEGPDAPEVAVPGMLQPPDPMGTFEALAKRLFVVIALHLQVALRAFFVAIKLTTDVAFLWHLSHSLPGISLPSDDALLAVMERALGGIPILGDILAFWMKNVFFILRNINLPEIMGGWNCGGAVYLALPLMLFAAMVVVYFALQKNFLVVVSIGIKSLARPKDGKEREFLKAVAERVSDVSTAICLFVMQSLIATLSGFVITSLLSASRSCSSLDKVLLVVSWPISMVIAVVCAFGALIIFAGRNLTVWAQPADDGYNLSEMIQELADTAADDDLDGEDALRALQLTQWYPTGKEYFCLSRGSSWHPKKWKKSAWPLRMLVTRVLRGVWNMYHAFCRIVLCTFGVWTNASVIAFDVLKSAYLFNFEGNDDNQHANIIALLGQANGLFWLIIPYGVFLTKLQEIVNAPPVFTFCTINPTPWRDDFQFPCFMGNRDKGSLEDEANAQAESSRVMKLRGEIDALFGATAAAAAAAAAEDGKDGKGTEAESGDPMLQAERSLRGRRGDKEDVNDPHDDADSLGFDQMGFSISVHAAPPVLDPKLAKRITEKLKELKKNNTLTEADTAMRDRLKLELLVLMEMGPLDLQSSLLRRCLEWVSGVAKYAAVLLILFQNEESSYALMGMAVALDTATNYLIELGQHANDIWSLGDGQPNPVRERRRAKVGRQRNALQQKFKTLVRESGERPQGRTWAIPAKFTRLGADGVSIDRRESHSHSHSAPVDPAEIAYIDDDQL